jgi:hypothetical protein
MAIFDLAPAIEISRKIVREKTNQVVLRLVPDTKTGQVAADRTFGLFLVGIFTIGLLALLVINTALAEDAFVLQDLKQQAQIITDQREAILRELASQSSPDKLAQNAIELGMIASNKMHFLDLAVAK